MKDKVTKKTCLSCGVCCMPPAYQDAFCDVEEVDIKRLAGKIRGCVLYPDFFSALTSSMDGRPQPYGVIKTKIREQKSGPFKGKELCMCSFLSGTIMKSIRCAVYGNRPKTCHVAVKPGDRACLKARKFWRSVARDQCTGKG
jgi:Fe-S-cluster containining protein